jgi:hypothetical protein
MKNFLIGYQMLAKIETKDNKKKIEMFLLNFPELIYEIHNDGNLFFVISFRNDEPLRDTKIYLDILSAFCILHGFWHRVELD